jgi:hypothetical protein
LLLLVALCACCLQSCDAELLDCWQQQPRQLAMALAQLPLVWRCACRCCCQQHCCRVDQLWWGLLLLLLLVVVVLLQVGTHPALRL